MAMFGKCMTGLAAVAMLAGSVGTAQARGWGGGWDRGRHHRGDGFDFGDFLLGGLLVGTVAVLASNKAKGDDARRPDDRPYNGNDNRYREARPDGDTLSRGDAGPGASIDAGQADSDGQGAIASEDAAVDACAVAARDKASVGGGYAEVKSINTVSPVRDGWDVQGTVERRSGYRTAGRSSGVFVCQVRGGWVSGVDLPSNLASL